MRLVDSFTTRDGSWEPNGQPYSIPPIAVTRYGNDDIPGKGSANHIMVRTTPGAEVYVNTTDGLNPVVYIADASGWVNHPMAHSSAYVPARGEQGPWLVWVNGMEIARGVGLPDGLHVATWLITAESEPPSLPPGPQPQEPTDLYLPSVKVGAMQQALRDVLRELGGV